MPAYEDKKTSSFRDPIEPIIKKTHNLTTICINVMDKYPMKRSDEDYKSVDLKVPVDSHQFNNYHTLPSLEGDTPLTEGKLLKAQEFLASNEYYVDISKGFIVIGPKSQFDYLQNRLKGPLENFFVSMEFIIDEYTGIDSLNNSYVFMYPKSAIKYEEARYLEFQQQAKQNPIKEKKVLHICEKEFAYISCKPLFV